MRSMRWSGAWGAVVAGVALAAAVAGCAGCARAGSFGLGTPGSGFALTGDGPGAFCRTDARVWTLPTAVEPAPGTRVRTDVGCMNAVMTVTAFRAGRPIRQWRGEVYWTGAIPITALMADAGVSPTALAHKWLHRGLRWGTGRLRRELADEAAALAAREMQAVRATLARVDDYATLPAVEQRRIVDAAGDAFQREYFARVERVAAAETARLKRRLADGAAGSAGHGGAARAYVDRQLRDDLQASERVWLSARQARAGFRPRVKAPAAKATGRRGTRLKPDVGAEGPHSTFKRDPSAGKVTGHAEWDAGGNPVKRTDVIGPAHGPVSTPHTHEYGPPNVNPATGVSYPGNEVRVRSATPDEIPR